MFIRCYRTKQIKSFLFPVWAFRSSSERLTGFLVSAIMAIKQVWHKYWLWEDYQNGMWRKESKQYEQDNLQAVIDFTGNHILYGMYMLLVVNKWSFSMEHNLTNSSINQKAYVGHCACCLYAAYPEYLVRSAWKHLTNEQRTKANEMAYKAIKTWQKEYENKNQSVH